MSCRTLISDREVGNTPVAWHLVHRVEYAADWKSPFIIIIDKAVEPTPSDAKVQNRFVPTVHPVLGLTGFFSIQIRSVPWSCLNWCKVTSTGILIVTK